MLSKSRKSHRYETILLDNLIEQDHLLRKIDRYIDFSFIHEKCKPLYCPDNGRPAIDPEILFKMLFLGYLYGIPSERKIAEEVRYNVAFRWFLGYSLEDKTPDASTIWQNRSRRFKQTDIAQEIFDEIVRQAIEKKLVDGKVLYSDSTHLKANANKKKFSIEQVKVEPKEYIRDLEAAVNEERLANGKKPLRDRIDDDDDTGAGHDDMDSASGSGETKDRKISHTDPESGYMCRTEKEKGFMYLDHRTVDAAHNIITDVHVTPGNVSDTDPYISRLDVQLEKFGFEVKAVGLDAGYLSAPICKALADRKIKGAIGYRRWNSASGKFHKSQFTFIRESNQLCCPNHCFLNYKNTSREGTSAYVANPADCSGCPQKERCLPGHNTFRTVYRHVWEVHREDVIRFTKSDKGKRIYKRRKETIERSFADSKGKHGLRYARYRGVRGVLEQCLLTAAAQNIKKIATMMAKKDSSMLPDGPLLFRFFIRTLKFSPGFAI